VLIPENRELLYTWDRDLGCALARAYNDAVAQDFERMRPSGEVHRRLLGFSATWNVGTVKMVKELNGMSEGDKDKILGSNAMRLFGM